LPGYHHHRLHVEGGQVKPGHGAGVPDADRAGAGAHEGHGHRPCLAAQVGEGDSAADGVQNAQVEGESVLGLDGHDDLQALNPVTIIRYVNWLRSQDG
jgi:hypothetical protein